MTQADLLRHPIHSGHLTVGALKRNKDKPVLFLGDTTLTGGQLADRISQYIQAFEALGAWLFYTATGGVLPAIAPDSPPWYLGEAADRHVWLIYRPELAFLKSPQAALKRRASTARKRPINRCMTIALSKRNEKRWQV